MEDGVEIEPLEPLELTADQWVLEKTVQAPFPVDIITMAKNNDLSKIFSSSVPVSTAATILAGMRSRPPTRQTAGSYM